MTYSVHQPQYLPWLGFFDKIDKSDIFVYLDDVQYKHREYQNRNRIRTKAGWIWLTVPVSHKRGEKIREVAIDNSRGWRQQHLRSLKSWYSGAEYFDKYFPFFEELYGKDWQRLCDLNVSIINFFLDALCIKKQIHFESDLNVGGEKTQRIINIGRKLECGVYISGAGGRDYLEEDKFSDHGITLRYQDFSCPFYRQQFAKKESDFIPNLSIIDLLFNEGENSLNIIRGSYV